jgi:hypothetical protein
MSNKFGIFINMNYAAKPAGDCAKILEKIKQRFLSNGYSFEKRVFVINTDKDIKNTSIEVRHLLSDIAKEFEDLHNYVSDCYMLDIKKYADLKLPDTSDSIDVEQIILEDLVLFENKI